MCALAAALNPSGKGKSGWSCAKGVPPPSVVCSWGGVTCVKNSVVAIALAGLGLAGSIPPSLGDISSLRSLDVSNNLIAGTVPSSLSKLAGLTGINISGNKFTGVIPTVLCQVSSHNLGPTASCGEHDKRYFRDFCD